MPCWKMQTVLRLAAMLLSRLSEWHRVLHKSNSMSYFKLSAESTKPNRLQILAAAHRGQTNQKTTECNSYFEGGMVGVGGTEGEGTTPKFQPFLTFSSRKLRNCWKTSLSETIGWRHILVIQACSLSIRILINSSSKRPVIQCTVIVIFPFQ